ncbi:MAG TPA: hypothetical protein PKN18_08600, partial [Pseudomonadales bacterium]|nr:hypothetical protein [Pseudomonadales bacterium]
KAILYYLAAEERGATRERLAGLLWSDWPEKKAREYLRGELFLLGPLRPDYLHGVDGSLSLDPATCASDVAALRSLTERAGATVDELDEALPTGTHFTAAFASIDGSRLDETAIQTRAEVARVERTANGHFLHGCLMLEILA